MNPSLLAWLNQQTHLGEYKITPLAGDASFRQYFRIHTESGSYIVMDAALEKQSCLPFVAIANGLRDSGLNTPVILAQDFSEGFLLLTDFGDRLYLRELNAANATGLYQKALDALVLLQRCQSINHWIIPTFTADVMRQELMLCKTWFFEKYLKLNFTPQEEAMLAHTFSLLTDSLAEQPQVLAHRDYHSANLMVLPHQQVGLLDFQDAFRGPVTYDVVSLLRDCYIDFPEAVVMPLALYYHEKLQLAVSQETFIQWFDWMGLQRHLKALLTFARKFLRDHHAGYVQYMPRTMRYLEKISRKYPDFQAFHELFQKSIQPAYERSVGTCAE